MTALRHLGSCPAPVATLRPRASFPTLTFSKAPTLTFSAAIAEPGLPIHVFWPDSAPVLHYTAWELPGEVESEPGVDIRYGRRLFEPALRISVLTDGRLAVTDSIGYRVKLVGLDGGLAGSIERPIAPLPIDDAVMEVERERYRKEAEALESIVAPDETFQVVPLTFTDDIPVLWDLKADWDDRIWIERRAPTGRDGGPIDIVTPEGGYVGTLAPDGLRTPDAFGPDGLMAYVESDDLGVETVRVVRLVALEPAG